MDIIRDTEFTLEHTAVCLGKFDGVHAGHRYLLGTAREECIKSGLTLAVFTFDMHPNSLLDGKVQKLLSTEAEKEYLLGEMGIDTMISYPFTRETANMEAEDFVKEVLVERCHAKMLVAGEDFRFGKGRGGDVTLLSRLSKQYAYKLHSIPKISMEGGVVSSTRIRSCIEKGQLECANTLLAGEYFIEGEVVRGNQMGRTMGMPTANLIPEKEKLLPPYGVYTSHILLDGKMYQGITNIGEKPTIQGGGEPGAETHIFEELPTFYGQRILVFLQKFLRREQKFDSLEKLKAQMERDVRQAKKLLGK